MNDTELAKRIHKIIREEFGGESMATNIVRAARKADIPVSLGCALVEQESSFRNVFGHDPTIFAGAGRVTKEKYLRYKAQRGHSRMQGVGPVQLTWWAFQDRADREGGCWKPSVSIQVGFQILADSIKQHGKAAGIAAYNGSGSAAQAYSRSVRAKEQRWHERLTAKPKRKTKATSFVLSPDAAKRIRTWYGDYEGQIQAAHARTATNLRSGWTDYAAQVRAAQQQPNPKPPKKPSRWKRFVDWWRGP